MYTIEDLEFSIGRLCQLRALLREVPHYNHCEWANWCGTPSCALGWATTLWPNELEIDDKWYVQTVGFPAHFGLRAGAVVFRISANISGYLFGSVCEFELYYRGDDESVETTISRIGRVEQYLRRRLATLLAEEESARAARVERRRQAVGV